MKTLSVLICHLIPRTAPIARLRARLNPQLVKHGIQVELIIDGDNGEVPTGVKRNRLLARASGSFTVFIDDDDLVHEDYLSKILDAIKENPSADCIGMQGIITLGGEAKRNPKVFKHSISYGGWYERDGVYYRTPNHLNPIASRHSKAVKFPEITTGEDHKWSEALMPLLKVETYIQMPIYFYEAK